MTARSWEQARNLLCVRLDSIGDVLMMTPAMRALKQSLPGRKLTLLTSPAGAQVAPLIPEVDDVLVYEAPWMKATPPRDAVRDFAMARELRARRFDGAVIFTTFSQSPLPAAMLCFLAGIPLRLAHCHENPYQLLSHWLPDPEPEQFIRHEVRRQLDLVGGIGCGVGDEKLSVAVPPDVVDETRRWLELDGIECERPWVVIHPGSTAASRRYAAASFAEVARGLSRDHGLQIVFTGSDADLETVRWIRAFIEVPSVSLAGRTDLARLAAVIAQATLLISNNTGPAHIAAAVGTPVVDIYAMTNAQHTPWQVPQRVLTNEVPCGYCYKSVCPEGHHLCLTGIPPETVVEAALSLMAETESKEATLAAF